MNQLFNYKVEAFDTYIDSFIANLACTNEVSKDKKDMTHKNDGVVVGIISNNNIMNYN